MKVKLTSSQRDFVETMAKKVNNNKYYFFDKIYVKIDGTNEFEEKEFKDLPEGIKKYIIQQFS